ncbi:MAG TPA: AI-2E family transporter [Gaiellales bacterium]|nr:AI-2E family transporter [Gaiellales bacterium]
MPPVTSRKVLIPRWVQLVGLPLVVIGAWQFVSAVSHAVFIFVVAALIAILLNPVVRSFAALRFPRPVAVLLVYLLFGLTFIAAGVLAGTVIATQAQSASTVVQKEFSTAPGQTETPAQQKLDRLQRWLNHHHLHQIDVRNLGDKVQQKIDSLDVQSVSGKAVSIAQGILVGVVESLFNVVLVIVVSVYMLLDAPRLSAFLRRLLPHEEGERDLMTRVERALISYVRGQIMVSLVIGVSAGVFMWVLGVTGIFQNGDNYAIAFGAFAALTEVIPYVGPWLGAIPPFIVALSESPTAALAVAIAFLIIHQIEGHIVIPKLMGGAVGVHPLLVIFALLAGEQLYGLAGVFITLPLVAVGRELFAFLRERIGMEQWRQGPLTVEVPVEVDPPRPPPPPPAEPGPATAG